jgi:uncharacterized protein
LSKSLIPEAALDKHVALLGMTGAGKTSVIKAVIVEPDLDADRRVLIITPKDDWWGLRLSKSGKGKGYDIPIFGGWHGDYPLLVKDAALLAETYGTMKGSAIFCTSRLSVQDRARWFAAFAETLLSTNRGFVRAVIDEAHVFMPKQGAKGGGAVPAALHAGNELVSQGRSLGLRIVLASQRSAKLHNDSLTQCSCLIAMLLMAPHDRDAVKAWIEDQADPQRGKEIISSLATLNPGQAWVWAPGAKFLERIQFPRPSTFDSSAAPDEDADDGPKLTPINLDSLKGKLARIEEEKKASDVPTLKKRIAELEAIAKKSQATAVPAADPKAVDDAYQNGLAEGLARGENRAKAALAAVESRLKDALATAEASLESLDSPAPTPLPRPSLQKTQRTPTPSRPAVPFVKPNGQFSGPQHRVLRSLAMWRALGHDSPSREMVAAASGYSPSSGGFNNLLGELVKAGAIGKPAPGHLSLLMYADDMSADEGREMLLGYLSNPQRRLVDALNGSGALSRDDLGARTEYSPSSGGFNNLIGSLSRLGLIVKPQPGDVALADWAQELLA